MSAVARLRVPGLFPAGLPDWPGWKRVSWGIGLSSVSDETDLIYPLWNHNASASHGNGHTFRQYRVTRRVDRTVTSRLTSLPAYYPNVVTGLALAAADPRGV